MLQCLKSNDAKFMVVGAYAMSAYGYPRATGDMDIWVMVSADNSPKVYNALREFGSPLSGIDQATFTRQGIVFQIGVAPNRIDILTRADGLDFEEAYPHRQEVTIGDISVPFVSKADLIKNKLSTGREKDRLDAQRLQSE